MPGKQYTVRDTQTGKTVTFQWDGEGAPSDSDLEEVFGEARKTAPTAPAASSTPTSFTGHVTGSLASFASGFNERANPLAHPIDSAVASVEGGLGRIGRALGTEQGDISKAAEALHAGPTLSTLATLADRASAALEALTPLGQPARDSIQAAQRALVSRLMHGEFGKAFAAGIPLVGEPLVEAGERASRGFEQGSPEEVTGALGEAVGTLAPFALTGKPGLTGETTGRVLGPRAGQVVARTGELAAGADSALGRIGESLQARLARAGAKSSLAPGAASSPASTSTTPALRSAIVDQEPPVQPGFTRLYRGETEASTGGGQFFFDRDSALKAGTRPNAKVKGPDTRQLLFVDIPTAKLQEAAPRVPGSPTKAGKREVGPATRLEAQVVPVEGKPIPPSEETVGGSLKQRVEEDVQKFLDDLHEEPKLKKGEKPQTAEEKGKARKGLLVEAQKRAKAAFSAEYDDILNQAKEQGLALTEEDAGRLKDQGEKLSLQVRRELDDATTAGTSTSSPLSPEDLGKQFASATPEQQQAMIRTGKSLEELAADEAASKPQPERPLLETGPVRAVRTLSDTILRSPDPITFEDAHRFRSQLREFIRQQESAAAGGRGSNPALGAARDIVRTLNEGLKNSAEAGGRQDLADRLSAADKGYADYQKDFYNSILGKTLPGGNKRKPTIPYEKSHRILFKADLEDVEAIKRRLPQDAITQLTSQALHEVFYDGEGALRKPEEIVKQLRDPAKLGQDKISKLLGADQWTKIDRLTSTLKRFKVDMEELTEAVKRRAEEQAAGEKAQARQQSLQAKQAAQKEADRAQAKEAIGEGVIGTGVKLVLKHSLLGPLLVAGGLRSAGRLAWGRLITQGDLPYILSRALEETRGKGLPTKGVWASRLDDQLRQALKEGQKDKGEGEGGE